MGEVVKLIVGRSKPGKKLPKMVLCKECGEPVETARVQALIGDDIVRPIRCVSCQIGWERRFDRAMQGTRERDTIRILR